MLACFSQSSPVSRVEANKQNPSARLLVACEVIFGCSASEIFPAFYEDIREEVLLSAYEMYEAIEHRRDIQASAKRILLEKMAKGDREAVDSFMSP